MTVIELCHVGYHCETSIIINYVLKQKKKLPFMLGRFEFNDIIRYLNTNNYESIYDRNLLEPIRDINNSYILKHSLYNFQFVHDYKLDNDTKITNYDVVKARFDEKIKNFKEILTSDTMILFIGFYKNIDSLHIHEFVNWCDNNKSNKNYHLLLFTYNSYTPITIPHVSIIKLDTYYGWYYLVEKETKTIIAQQQYEAFIQCLKENNIEHNFPLSFEDSGYA